MKVLGVDPGYERMGIAVLEKKISETLLYSDCVRTKMEVDFSLRLKELGEALEIVIKKWRPDIVAVEKLFLTKNQKTASRVSEVRGMVLYISALRGIETREYTPLEIKTTITGFGKADKRQVAEMIHRTLRVPAKKMLDDEYDAIATGLTCIYKLPATYPH